MSYGVHGYGTREYGDSTRVLTEAAGGPPPSGDPIAGTDTLTFSGSATLTAAVAIASSGSAVVFAGSGTLSGYSTMMTDPSLDRLKFGGYATLSVEVAVVPPPSDVVYIKRVSPTMPTPTLDANGQPT